MSFAKKIFLPFFFLFIVLRSTPVSAAGDCRFYFGSQCVSSIAECNSNQYYDSMSTCPSESPICCRLIEENPTPTPTEKDQCSQNGGACYPNSTACYGGVENELPYSCAGSGQHCCKKTVNNCQDNGGTCVSSATPCDRILPYSCGESGNVCCSSTGKSSGGSWQQGIIQAGQTSQLPDSEISYVLEKITTYTLSLLTLIGVLFFVITGLKYIVAGSTGSTEKSKLGIQHLILGITIGLSGYIIIKFINAILQG